MARQSTFGERVRDLRLGKSITQQELARQVGIGAFYLCRIENDKAPAPSVATIQRLARALGADVCEFILLAGRVPPEVPRLLKENAAARAFYREAFSAGLSHEGWEEMVKALRQQRLGAGVVKEPFFVNGGDKNCRGIG